MPGDPQRAVSGRIQVARLAERAIALTDGVGPTRGADGRWITADGDRTISGVIAAEDGAGRIEVELHLEASWPPEPFDRLAGEMRRRLRRSAGSAGLGDRLGALHVSFHDIVVPETAGSPP